MEQTIYTNLEVGIKLNETISEVKFICSKPISQTYKPYFQPLSKLQEGENEDTYIFSKNNASAISTISEALNQNISGLFRLHAGIPNLGPAQPTFTLPNVTAAASKSFFPTTQYPIVICRNDEFAVVDYSQFALAL